MLELDFQQFMKYFERNRKDKSQNHRMLHYEKKSDRFILYIKSEDYWEYQTEILFKDLEAFASVYEGENAVEDFQRTVLFDAMPLKEKVVAVQGVPVEDQQAITKDVNENPEPMDNEEAEDYASFLNRKFKGWEAEIMKFLDRTIGDEIAKAHRGKVLEHLWSLETVDKTFGEFLRNLFNRVNTIGFVKELKGIVRTTLKDGLAEGEQELDVDIGTGVNFNTAVRALTDRQLNGFYIQGKKWPGLKGVAKETQENVIKIVNEGIAEQKSLKDIKNDVKGEMSKLYADETSDGRAMMIARTETNRIKTMGKIQSYKDSGVVKAKEWNAFLDNRTSEICKRLNGQRVHLDQNFVDPLDGREYTQPPETHPNCRCTVVAHVE